MKSDLTRKVTSAITPTKSAAAPTPKKGDEESPARYHSYLVLYHDGDHMAFEGIELNKRPKGKPKDVAFALATILGLDHSKVVGVLHITPGIDIKLSKCGMEMLFTLSK